MPLCTATIIENRSIAVDFYKMTLSCENFSSPKAGQFLSIQLPSSGKMILRRPFAYSAFDIEKKEASIIYQKRGEGTALLSQKKIGESLSILTNLGTPFPMPSDRETLSREFFKRTKKIYLVAGGVGLGPMLFTHQLLKKEAFPCRLIAGFRTKSYLPNLNELSVEQGDAEICCDDGSFGFKGTVVDYLKTLKEVNWQETALFCCGPLPMMKALHSFAESINAPLFVSMEEMMGCAVGACMGCLVKTTDEKGYARVCKEGAVFDSRQILWEEAIKSPLPQSTLPPSNKDDHQKK